jgi:ankyrin repeat protein
LHICSACDSLECFILLERYGGDLSQPSGTNLRPIHYACAFGSFEIVCYILNQSPSEAKRSGLILLTTQNGQAEILEYLFVQGARGEEGESPVSVAITKADVRCLAVLLKYGERRGDGWTTPLMAAVTRRNEEAVRLLLQAGEYPNAKDRVWEIALACFLREEKIVEMLLAKCAQIDPISETSCEGGVHWLCHSHSPKIAKMMLEKGIDVSRVDGKGHVGPRFLVDTAGEDEAIEILQMLVSYGWDIDQPDVIDGEREQRTSTLLGAYVDGITKPVKVIRWLIEHGADLRATAGNGKGRIIDALKAPTIAMRSLARELSDLIEQSEREQEDK